MTRTPVRAEIITIGRELLDGTRVDTNTSTIARALAAIGASVERATSVPDDPAAIERAIVHALETVEIVVTTGGLGPTSDDRTKQVVARIFGRGLALDEGVLAAIRARYESLGRELPELVASQAMVPEGARAIENARGTAPGLLFQEDGGLLFALPGVPSEMRAMLENYVVPFLEGTGLRRVTAERLLRTTGIPESVLAERIASLSKRLARTDVAYLPRLTGVDIRLIGRGASAREAEEAVAKAAAKIREKIEPYVYAEGAQSLEEVVGYLLSMNGRTVSVAESCTGGRLGWQITRQPGSSGYFTGGVIAYSDDLKRRLLGVRAGELRGHGAVSGRVAARMAAGVRAKARTDYGVAITGIAGPSGATEDKPIGLVWIAVSSDAEERTRELRLSGGDRDEVRAQASQAALELLRRTLLGLPESD